VAYYWDNPVSHDRPLITNLYAPGFAEAAGLSLKDAQQARDAEMFLANIRYSEQEGRRLSYSLNNNHNYSRMTAHRARNITRMIDAAGLAINHPAPQGRLGKQSQIEATPALIELWDKLNPEVVYDRRFDHIICRSRKDPYRLLEVRHSPDKIRQMDRYNEMQGANSIGMEATGAINGQNGSGYLSARRSNGGGRPRFCIGCDSIPNLGLRSTRRTNGTTAAFTDPPRTSLGMCDT
jgi:hypothetical protein